MILKYNIVVLKYISLILILLTFSIPANSEMSVEETIKGRKAIFSKNYKTLIEYFPNNTKEGHNTEALPAIWENKDEFNDLMTKASINMIKLAEVIDQTDNVRGTLTSLMWSNCKACHSKFREEH